MVVINQSIDAALNLQVKKPTAPKQFNLPGGSAQHVLSSGKLLQWRKRDICILFAIFPRL